MMFHLATEFHRKRSRNEANHKANAKKRRRTARKRCNPPESSFFANQHRQFHARRTRQNSRSRHFQAPAQRQPHIERSGPFQAPQAIRLLYVLRPRTHNHPHNPSLSPTATFLRLGLHDPVPAHSLRRRPSLPKVRLQALHPSRPNAQDAILSENMDQLLEQTQDGLKFNRLPCGHPLSYRVTFTDENNNLQAEHFCFRCVFNSQKVIE